MTMNETGALDRELGAAAEAGQVPGLVAMAADVQGVLYEGAFGRRALPDGAPMTVDTVFWMASMTKAVTTVAAMQLVEQGALELEAPIGDLLPALAEPLVLEGFADTGAPRLRPARGPITLRQLLTHTAGFSYHMWNQDIARYLAQTGLPGVISCEDRALGLPLVFDPGERWEYGINIDWAGKAVEAVSGLSLDVYLRERVFAPLGMDDTGFTIGPSQRTRLAAMHARSPDGSLSPIEFEVPQSPEFFMGGGGLYSTGGDYIRFLQMLLNGGRLDGAEVLRPETVALMQQNHIGALEVGPLLTAGPDISNDAEFLPGMVKKWGLGFLINTEAGPAGRSAGSLAWGGLANGYYWLDPAAGVCGLILTQILPFADPTVLDLFAKVETGAYALRASRAA